MLATKPKKLNMKDSNTNKRNSAFSNIFTGLDKPRPWKNICQTCNKPETFGRLTLITGDPLELCHSSYQEQSKPENLLRFVKAALDKAIKEA